MKNIAIAAYDDGDEDDDVFFRPHGCLWRGKKWLCKVFSLTPRQPVTRDDDDHDGDDHHQDYDHDADDGDDHHHDYDYARYIFSFQDNQLLMMVMMMATMIMTIIVVIIMIMTILMMTWTVKIKTENMLMMTLDTFWKDEEAL